MIKVLPPPSEAEEYRNTAEILRDLAAQTRFDETRKELFICADNLDRLVALAEHQPEATVQTVRVPLDNGLSRTRADCRLEPATMSGPVASRPGICSPLTCATSGRRWGSRSIPAERGEDINLCVPGGSLDPLTPSSMRHGDTGCGSILAGGGGWATLLRERAFSKGYALQKLRSKRTALALDETQSALS
jgi:hypothetical protein